MHGKRLTAEQQRRWFQVACEELDAADAEATNEQLVTIFSKAVETLSAVTDNQMQQMQTDVQAKLAELQAKITVSENKGKKFSANLSL